MIGAMRIGKLPVGAFVSLVLSLVLVGCSGTLAPVYQGSRWAAISNVSEPEPAEHPTPGIVTVRRGDTLYRLARTYNTPLQDLIWRNDLTPPYLLMPGDKLHLPSPRYHTVAGNDTIYSVSRTYDVPVLRIAELNEIDTPYNIRVGQRLRLPADADFAAASPYTTGSISSGAARSTSWLALASPPPTKKPTTIVRDAPRAAVSALSNFGGTQGFTWPVRGRVISNYGPKRDGLHNDGINISVKRGTPVRASKRGVVTYAGNELKGYGNLLLIKHDDGFVTAYAHNNRLLASRGDIVEQGEIIAEAGSTGAVSSVQLHFEIRRGRRAFDPSSYLPGA